LQIKEHGYDVPIVIDENKVIIKGHARLAACKKLKMKTIPCIIRTDLSDEQKRAARIADNRLGELAELDIDALNAEFEHLKSIDYNIELIGFDAWPGEDFVPDLPDDKESDSDKAIKLIITFQDEVQQQELFEELKTRGYKVKAG